MRDPSAVPSGAKARATYETLLAATERLIAAEGAGAVSSTAVAAAAGVATGTFYTYFADKDEILAALFARRLDELTAAVEGVLTADALLDRGLRATLEEAVEVILAGYRRHAPVIRAALARIPATEAIRDIYWTRHERALAAVARFLERGRRAGLVRADAGDVLAHTMIILTQALNHPVLLAPGNPQLVAGLRSELAELLHHLLAPR